MKARKAFGKFDIMLYISLVLLVTLLFLLFAVLPKKTDGDGFKVFLGEVEVFTFNYSDGSYSVVDGQNISVTEKDEVYSITVKTEKGFNLIVADKIKKTVEVLDADCSIRKDCVHSPKIKGNDGVIVCVPHELKIMPTDGGFIPPIAG